MIDDTQGTVSADYSTSLSREVLQITKYRTDRHDALDWAKNLRFLAFDDSSYEPALDELPRRQECSHCHAKPRFPTSMDGYIDAEIIHVCDKPFHNKHSITEEDWKKHPQRFSCDMCNRSIFHGSRHHCGECRSGDFDICDHCIESGKHCHDGAHLLEKILVFEFGDCVHVNARSCKDCERIPIFPSEGEITKFRVVQLADEDSFSSCDHFIAVSYCWPPPRYDKEGSIIQHQGRYDVTEQSGRVRKNRAPEDVIDRAVQFAVQNGIRLVWIDQECIDQENPMEKELGIQAMDKVYQRAFLSAGLLRTKIETERSLEGLKYLLAESGELCLDLTDHVPTSVVDAVMAFFEPLINDLWHTRAWILQEAFSAGSRMCLLLQHNPEIRSRDYPGISKILSKSEIVIQVDQFLVLIDYARGYLTRSLITIPATDTLSKRRLALLRRFAEFTPGDERSLNVKWTHTAGKTKARRSCSAAVALSYLRKKQNTHVPDRLAILANLCNYDIRLDTIELEKNHTYLGGSPTHDESDFTWMTTTPDKLRDLEARNINSLTHYFHHFFPSEIISEKGLTVPGYLWKVDKRIHIPELNVGSNKIQWFQTRYSVFVYNILRSPSYSPQTFKEIQKSSMFQDLDQETQDKVTSSMSKGNSLSPSEYEDWATDYRVKILKQHPRGYEIKFQAIVSSYLIRILYILRNKKELEVADAIWQSIRKDNWEIRLTFEANQARGWFNSVADFPPWKEDGMMPMTVQVMIDMLQLDWDREGSFYQCWLIDNVMRDGWIAVGKFVRVSMHDEFEIHPEWIEDLDPPSNEDLIEGYGDPGDVTSQAENLAHSPGEPTLPISEPTGTESPETILSPPGYSTTPELALTQNEPAQPYDFSEHGDVQLFKQLMKSSFLSLIEDLPSRNLANKIPLAIGAHNSKEAQNILATAMLYGHMESDWREANHGGGAGRLGSMRAVFDVNSTLKTKDKLDGEERNREGTVFVLTPFDERTERLPHTEARVMSMSWLVEPTDECPDGKAGVREVFRTSGNVRGMWRMVDRPATEYLLV